MKNYQSLTQINAAVQSDAVTAIRQANLAFQTQLQNLAQQLLLHADAAPIILLAGPSGSGKTTTAYMLADLLRTLGRPAHTLSLDNYFRTITPEEKRIGIDLESPDRVDADLLNQQLSEMLAGKPVRLPHYDFNRTENYLSDQILQRKPEELIILEGIHALNPDVIRLPETQRQTIYVSIHTHITFEDTTMHPLYVRLLRRMLRDQKFRSRSIAQTLELFPKVEAGKRRFIKPYRSYANYEVDTFFPYELGIYRCFLLHELEQLPENETVSLLTQLLRQTELVDYNLVPNTALIQEFLGNSIYFNN